MADEIVGSDATRIGLLYTILYKSEISSLRAENTDISSLILVDTLSMCIGWPTEMKRYGVFLVKAVNDFFVHNMKNKGGKTESLDRND